MISFWLKGTWIKSLRQRFRDSRRPLVNIAQVAAMKTKYGLSKQQKSGRSPAQEDSFARKRRNSSVLIPVSFSNSAILLKYRYPV